MQRFSICYQFCRSLLVFVNDFPIFLWINSAESGRTWIWAKQLNEIFSSEKYIFYKSRLKYDFLKNLKQLISIFYNILSIKDKFYYWQYKTVYLTLMSHKECFTCNFDPLIQLGTPTTETDHEMAHHPPHRRADHHWLHAGEPGSMWCQPDLLRFNSSH